MTEQSPGRDALRNTIAATIWLRVTREDGDWNDIWEDDRQEYLDDADAVLAALVAEGYRLPELPSVDSGVEAPAAVDVLARHAMFRMAQTNSSLFWANYPGLTEADLESLVQRVLERAEADKPADAEVMDAYEQLSARAKVGSVS